MNGGDRAAGLASSRRGQATCTFVLPVPVDDLLMTNSSRRSFAACCSFRLLISRLLGIPYLNTYLPGYPPCRESCESCSTMRLLLALAMLLAAASAQPRGEWSRSLTPRVP